MQIIVSVRGTAPEPDAVRLPSRVRLEVIRAHRARLATLRTRAPDTLRARIRRELRAAEDRAARR